MPLTKRFLLTKANRIQRYSIKNKGFKKRYEKTSQKKKGRIVWQKKRKKLYRSLLMYAYTKPGRGEVPQNIEMTIWIHTRKETITEDELSNKFGKFKEAVFTQGQPPISLLLKGYEINREIDPDEIIPNEIDVWLGFAEFEATRSKGQVYEKKYYYKDTGDGFSETSSFSVPDVTPTQ